MLYNTSADLKGNTANEGNIKQINPRLSISKRLVIHYDNGTKKEILKSSVWGYRDKTGNNYRLSEEREYEIKKMSPIVTYHCGKNYYFSKDLDSPIYDLTRKKLKNILGDSSYYSLKPVIVKWQNHSFR